MYEISVRALEDLVNPFRAVGYTKEETDAIVGRVGLALVPPGSIVSLPTVKRVTAQEGIFFNLEHAQVHALERDCIDRYYFRHRSERNKDLSTLYSAIFPADELLDRFVEKWKKRNPDTI